MDVFEKFLHEYKSVIDLGFYWTDPLQIINHVKLELDEVKTELDASNPNALQEELGDVMHACMELIDFCGFDPKETLALANQKFEKRFQLLREVIEEEDVHNFKSFSREQKLALWDKAKQKERQLLTKKGQNENCPSQ
jgi:uncharacterized protein YabN with tetrapyrrole methylase and pyrophosphatase domain